MARLRQLYQMRIYSALRNFEFRARLIPFRAVFEPFRAGMNLNKQDNDMYLTKVCAHRFTTWRFSDSGPSSIISFRSEKRSLSRKETILDDQLDQTRCH